MIFLSQLLQVPIMDSRQEQVGRLKDIIVRSKNETDYPQVQGIVFKVGSGLGFIPYDCIENLSYGEVTLKKSNCSELSHEFVPEDIFLMRDLVDQQIFDMGGIRVVRVNDLQLVKIEERFCLVGIDVSSRGLIRRLGLDHWPFFKSIQSQYIDWQNVSLIPGDMAGLKLKTSYEKLEKLHPADIANLIENLSLQESSKLVESIDKETAAEVLGEVEPEYKETLLERMNPKDLAKILEEMPTDEAADVIQELSEEKRLEVLRRLGVETAKTLSQLTEYGDDIAGGLMTTEYMVVPQEYTVAQATEEIRKKSEEFHSIYHVYIVNTEGTPKGVVSIRTLLLAAPEIPLKTLMAKVIKTVKTNVKAKEVAQLMTKYNLLSIAVVDKHKKIQGIITVDDILRFLVPNA